MPSSGHLDYRSAFCLLLDKAAHRYLHIHTYSTAVFSAVISLSFKKIGNLFFLNAFLFLNYPEAICVLISGVKPRFLV